MGIQCKGCCYNQNNKCVRVGTSNKTNRIGVCWMEKSEGEY